MCYKRGSPLEFYEGSLNESALFAISSEGFIIVEYSSLTSPL